MEVREFRVQDVVHFEESDSERVGEDVYSLVPSSSCG